MQVEIDWTVNLKTNAYLFNFLDKSDACNVVLKVDIKHDVGLDKAHGNEHGGKPDEVPPGSESRDGGGRQDIKNFVVFENTTTKLV